MKVKVSILAKPHSYILQIDSVLIAKSAPIHAVTNVPDIAVRYLSHDNFFSMQKLKKKPSLIVLW